MRGSSECLFIYIHMKTLFPSITVRAQTSYGSSDKEGNYDGIFGDLQQNLSDFCGFPAPIEGFSPSFEIPVDVGPVITRDMMAIMSTPLRDITKRVVDIEESLLVISWGVVLLFVVIFCFSKLLIVHICPLLIVNPKLRDKKIQSLRTTFDLFRHILSQGPGLSSDFFSQALFLLTYASAFALLILYYKNYMSSEMVVYSKPTLIRSLDDLLKPDLQQRITFPLASVLTELMRSSEKKRFKEIWRKASEQWKDNPKKMLLGGEDILNTHRRIESREIIVVSPLMPLQMTMAIYCAEVDEETQRQKTESNIMIAEDDFFSNLCGVVSSKHADPRVKRRLDLVYLRGMEAGIHRHVQIYGAEETLNDLRGILGIGASSLGCLNSLSWNRDTEIVTQINFDNIDSLVVDVMFAVFVSVVVLILEIVYHAAKEREKKKRMEKMRNISLGNIRIRMPRIH